MTETTYHITGNKIVFETACAEAYKFVQMADGLPVQLWAFNFASRTFAYICLSQGLYEFDTEISSFVMSYIESCRTTNFSRQSKDDIAAGVSNFEEIILALRESVDCLREMGLKLSTQNCEFRTLDIDYLSSSITPKVSSPESAKNERFKILRTK